MSDQWLSHAEELCLRRLAAPGTRWHDQADIAQHVGLAERVVRSTLAGLRRRGCVVQQAHLGPASRSWSITTTGAMALGEEEAA
jgi:DNA-binding IclR family transcriptional regulator